MTAVLAVAPITTYPPNHTSLTQFLCIGGASAAIDFYVSVFGAKLVDRMDGRLQLGDPAEAYRIAAVDPKAPATHSVAFYCEDVDAVVAKAEQAGATIREPAQTFVTGDRFASILDPFGQPLDRDDPRRGRLPRGTRPPHGRVGEGKRRQLSR